MLIGVLTLELDLYDADSLKAKRAVLNRLKTKVRSSFNVSIAEVEANEVWNYACLGVCVVANQQRFANQVLDKVVDYVETLRDCQLIDHGVEFVRLS